VRGKSFSDFLPQPGRQLLEKVQVNLPFPMLVENLESVLSIGLQPEIYFSSQTLDHLSFAATEEVSRKLKEKETSVTFHAPFMDLNPGAVDERIRETTAFRFSQIMELVPLFNPKAIVFHPGYDHWRYDDNVDLWLEKSLLTWKPLVKRAQELAVKLALENIFEDNPSSLQRLLEVIDSPFLGYCLDPGHGQLFSKVALTDWIEVLGSRLVEIHLHDNHGHADDHLPLGQGKIDFPAIFSRLQEKSLHPIYTIEPHSLEHLGPSLQALKKCLGG
jgi:sugar phosphate isomerase/epimerase